MKVWKGKASSPIVCRHASIGAKEYSIVRARKGREDVQLLPAPDEEGELSLKVSASSIDINSFVYAGDIVIDWGDGSFPEHVFLNTSETGENDRNLPAPHTYATEGEHTIKIKGYLVWKLSTIAEDADLQQDEFRQALLEVSCSGVSPIRELRETNTDNIQGGRVAGMFEGCVHLTKAAGPLFNKLCDTERVYRLSHCFHNCPALEEFPIEAITSLQLWGYAVFDLKADHFASLYGSRQPNHLWTVPEEWPTHFMGDAGNVDLSAFFENRQNIKDVTWLGILKRLPTRVTKIDLSEFFANTALSGLIPFNFFTSYLLPSARTLKAVGMFRNCRGLAGSSDGKGFPFKNLADFFNESVGSLDWLLELDFSEMFKGCAGLTGNLMPRKSDSAYDLWYRLYDFSGSWKFNSFFEGCSQAQISLMESGQDITSQFFDLFPNHPRVDLSYFFKDCSAISFKYTENVRSCIESNVGRTKHGAIFRNCSNIDGYANMHSNYK